jgi:hypothetical protein
VGPDSVAHPELIREILNTGNHRKGFEKIQQWLVQADEVLIQDV